MRAWHLAVLLSVGCRPADPARPPDRAADALAARLELDSMLAAGRRAHLETDPERLAAGLADTLLSIDEGAVTFQPKDSVRAMFGRYFSGASYRAWEDIRPPVVQISDDNSLAWVARVVCVDREEPVAGGNEAAADVRLSLQCHLRAPRGTVDHGDGDVHLPADPTSGMPFER